MRHKVFTAALALAVPAALPAQERAPVTPLPLGATVAADVVSSYVFRGVDVTDAPAVQPWATLSLGNTGLSVTAWASFAATGRDETVPYSTTLTRGGTDEVDLSAAFSRAVGPVAAGAGYIVYIYPAEQQDYVTQEVYGSLGLASVPFAPTLSVFYDFDGGGAGDVDTIEGLYASLGAARSIPLGTPLDLGASIGYTDQEALRADAGFNDVNVSAGIAIPFRGLTITPSLAYTHLFDGSAYAPDGDDTVWGKLQFKLTI